MTVGLEVEEKTYEPLSFISEWEWVIRNLIGGSWAEGIVSEDQEFMQKGVK